MTRRLFLTGAYAVAAVVLMGVGASAQDVYPDAKRIVSVGGSVTEVIFALGEQDRLVARDTTSNFPPEVFELPDVGYIRRLSPEGILSVNPDLIIAEDGSGPNETVELLAEAQIPFITIPDGYDRESIMAKVTAVASVLGVPEKGAALAAKIDADLDAAETFVAQNASKKRVLFVLTMNNGRFMVSGTNTGADGIIKMAGGINVISEFEGYKPLTDEALSASMPDVILMMHRTGQHQITDDDLVAHPAISITPAAQNRAFLRMDGMLMLGFGPRTATAIRDLSEMLSQVKG